MVKCPRGNLSQIKANLLHFQPAKFSFPSGFFSWTYDPVKGEMVRVGERESEVLGAESEDSDLDSARADKRSPPTARDELVYFFISYFLDILIESWESKPCKKSKLGPQIFASNEGEDYGEDSGPCEESAASSTMDLLKDLAQKRSSQLSKENIKKDSESSESEYLNEVELEVSECADPIHAFVPDEEVYFKFYNGVWYRGRVSRKLMEGDGTYFWEDGASYQGEFVGGCVTGKGRLEFSSMSVYEGGVYKAFRHGEGICCFIDSPVMYSGQWWLGEKHGYGLIVYNDPSEGQSFYRGQWQNGYKEGFGFRQYPSGAKYIGFWSNGQRHGKGVMIWSNHDIYRGQWKEGLMHGYGEYTWSGFANKTLSYPASNTYRGLWSEGKRDGLGVFECKNGALIETFWCENVKSGAGTVICCNGAVISSENLFEKDKQAPFSNQEDNLGLLVGNSPRPKRQGGKRSTDEKHFMAYLGSVERAKAISIPILSPPHTLNLDCHIQKYYLQKKLERKRKESEVGSTFEMKFDSEDEEVPWNCLDDANEVNFDSKNVEFSMRDSSDPCQLTESMAQEDKLLRNYIVLRTSELKACYDHYATLACEKPPSFQCILLRIFLWQMLIDAGIPSSELSLIDIDVMAAKEESLLVVSPHDPFERIYFWQFLQILILLSWHLYGQYVLGGRPLVETERITNFLEYFENAEFKPVLKTAFEYLLKNDIFKERFDSSQSPFSSGEAGFEDSDLAPMEAMYFIYCSIGVPHSVKDFLNAVCRGTNTGDSTPSIVRYFEKLPYYKMDGRNALTVAGDLYYIPGNEPFNHPRLFPLEKSRTGPVELTCFNDLKPRDVLKCLIQVCPSIESDGSVVNMDYKLTFLEFYRVIILCTERQLKLRAMKEVRSDLIRQYKIQLEEYERRLETEKRNEVATVSRKKSRQQLEGPKKGRKNTSNE